MNRDMPSPLPDDPMFSEIVGRVLAANGERLDKQWQQMGQMRWTPVSERLPEIGERVMMCHAEWRWINIGERVRIGDYIGWEDGDGEDLHDPTHWMPLPKLPYRTTSTTYGESKE